MLSADALRKLGYIMSKVAWEVVRAEDRGSVWGLSGGNVPGWDEETWKTLSGWKRGKKQVVLACGVLCSLLGDLKGAMAVGLPLSPSPHMWLPHSSSNHPAPYILCHESYSVQLLYRPRCQPHLGLTCGCSFVSDCRENQGSICLQLPILSVSGVSQQE